MVGGHAALIGPVEGVFAPEQQDRAAAIRRAVTSHSIIAVALFPHLGIAEILRAAALGQVLRGEHRVGVDLFIVHAVPHRQALGLPRPHGAVLLALLAHAGVHQQLPAIRKLDGAAGEAAVLVVGHVGRQSRGQPLPADEIAGLEMAPVHRPPHGLVGIVLVKQVVLALVDGEAVGIIDPADGPRDVKFRALFFRYIGHVLGFKIPRLLQSLADHMRLLLVVVCYLNKMGFPPPERGEKGEESQCESINPRSRRPGTSDGSPGNDPGRRPAGRSAADPSRRR